MATQKLKLVMMGTGDFAVPTFLGLYDTAHAVAALFTQPDPTGPGRHKSHLNAMKRLAEERGTAVFQPANVNSPEVLDQLRALAADVYVVAAYGQILSPELLSLPRLAVINVHASLLPRHRGAAPVAYAILSGDEQTGVSIIQVLPRLDAGPVLAAVRTPIGPRETAGELEDRLAQLAATLIPVVLDQLAAGTVQPVPQAEGLVTRAPKLRKQMGEIDWTRTAAQIDCHVRAMQPWPLAYTWIHAAGKPPQRVIVLEVHRIPGGGSPPAPPGEVLRADPAGLLVQAGTDALQIVRIQAEGKRAMSAGEFLRGNPVRPGDRLGGNE